MRRLTKQLSWRNFAQLFLAGCINAFGVTVFLAPVRLYDSGISGTAILLSQLTPLPLSAFLLLLNVPLFLFGLKKQGVVFTVYSLFAVTVYAWGSWMITDVLPIDVAMASPLAGEDLLLCALFGGVSLRHRKRPDHPQRGSHRRHGCAGGDLCQGAEHYGGHLCDHLQCGAVCPLRCGLGQLDPAALFHCRLCPPDFKTIDFIAEGIDRSKAVMDGSGHPGGDQCRSLGRPFPAAPPATAAVGRPCQFRKNRSIYFVVNRFQISRVRSMVRGLDPQGLRHHYRCGGCV